VECNPITGSTEKYELRNLTHRILVVLHQFHSNKKSAVTMTED